MQPGGARSKPFPVCCACGRAAHPITAHRSEAEPFVRRFWDAFAFPLGSTGIISLFFVGLIRALTSYVGAGSMMGMGAAVFVLRQGLYWAFVFFVIRSCAAGERRMGVFGFTDLQSDIITPAIKGVVSTAILWIPAVLYIYFAADSGIAGLFTYPSHRDPAVWLLALLGALYVPMALIAAATDLGFGSILNPIFIAKTIFSMGKDYFVAVVAVGVVMGIGNLILVLLGAVLALLPVPFLGRWLAFTFELYPAFVAAGILGILLYVHGEVLDWGRSEEYQVLVLPGVEPRGRFRPKQVEPPRSEPVRAAVPVPAPDRQPSSVAQWPGTGMVQGADPPSILNLSAVLGGETQEPPREQAANPPSLPNLSTAPVAPVLEAQAFIEHGDTGQFEMEPVDLPTPVVPEAAAPEPEASSAARLHMPPPPVIAPEVPSPTTSSVPTVLGFSPVFPLAEAPATVIGHTGLASEVPDSGPPNGDTGKGR